MTIIHTEEATIRTATIEIKALTVNGKQVTMGLFRQLLAEDLIVYDDSHELVLAGQVWGHVNYFWKPCYPDHLHAVWQKDEELRRACVWQERRGGNEESHAYKYESNLHAPAHAAVIQALIAGQTPGMATDGVGGKWVTFEGYKVFLNGSSYYAGNHCTCDPGWDDFGLIDDPVRPQFRNEDMRREPLNLAEEKRYETETEVEARLIAARVQRVVKLREVYEKRIGDDEPGQIFFDLRQKAQALHDLGDARHERHRELYEEIAATPQLFVAV